MIRISKTHCIEKFSKISRCFSSSQQFVDDFGNKYQSSQGKFTAPKKTKRDVIIIGGGHNGLVSAAYLAKQGLDVLLLERRHTLGGAAVTEEMVPGFKFSRASYLAGLLRPHIIKDLELEKYGFKYLPRNPSSFTPTKLDSEFKGKYLILGENEEENWKSIAQFSKKDADQFPKYEAFLGRVREVIQPLLDNPPFQIGNGTFFETLRTIKKASNFIELAWRNKEVLVPFYELFTGPAKQILDRWFESEILKTTLATDAVIGALISPRQNGSAYVLLHHVMGEAAGKKGVWAYVQGGMGAISNAIAQSAQSKGAELITNATVKKVLTENDKVIGVEMADGTILHADTVLSGTSPYHTFVELMPESSNPDNFQNKELGEFIHHIRHTGNLKREKSKFYILV